MLAGDIIIGGEAAHYLDDDDVTTLKRLVEERSAFHTDHFTLRKSLCLDNQNEIGAALRFVQTFIDEICGHARLIGESGGGLRDFLDLFHETLAKPYA